MLTEAAATPAELAMGVRYARSFNSSPLADVREGGCGFALSRRPHSGVYTEIIRGPAGSLATQSYAYVGASGRVLSIATRLVSFGRLAVVSLLFGN